MPVKTIKKYIYDGFGFPVVVRDVKMVKIGGEYHPKIDIKKLAKTTIQNLIQQESRFTWNQIKFISP